MKGEKLNRFLVFYVYLNYFIFGVLLFYSIYLFFMSAGGTKVLSFISLGGIFFYASKFILEKRKYAIFLQIFGLIILTGILLFTLESYLKFFLSALLFFIIVEFLLSSSVKRYFDVSGNALHVSFSEFRKFMKSEDRKSLLPSICFIIVFISMIFFPFLSFLTNSSLPIVIVESCSMYHESNFDGWWDKNSGWYEAKGIYKEDFREFPLKNGLNKGDIVFVWGRSDIKLGDIIIFNAKQKYPLIHRVVELNPLSTKGDHNPSQLPSGIENNISEDKVLGKAVFRIPYLGWIKLFFYEFIKPPEQRGFCR